MTKRIKSRVTSFIVPIILAMSLSSPAKALDIVINDITVGGASAQSLAAMNAAAAVWEAVLTDPVTVNIDFDFAPLGPTILGGTGSNTIASSVAATVAAMAADATSADDGVAVANLPAGGAISFRTNLPGGGVFLDNNGSGNNTFLDVNRATAKALGLLAPNAAGADADITFSSTFAFDFDPSDGIGAGLFDFVGVAIHELGHALGFVSGVDIVDITSGVGPFAPVDLNNFRVHSTLDLFRYSAESLALGAGIFDYATGPHAALPYFSIDGGITNLATFETGQFNGTGRQASHWRDGLGLGIMDPTFSSGELGVVSALDLRAFDVMGWDLRVAAVPEPGSLALLGIGLLGVGMMRRRRRL